MYRNHDTQQIIYSPSDLTRYMESPFAAWMDRLFLDHPERITPDDRDEELQLYADEGIRHEAAFVKELEDAGKDVCQVAGNDFAEKEQKTRDAIKAAREIIFQARLTQEPFAGYADFLVRVSNDAGLYEVWDTKLAKSPKAYYLVQLCCYAEMLETVQGLRPEHVAVVLGNNSIRKFRTDDYWYYFQQLKAAFLELMAAFDPDAEPPEPDSRADHGRWQSYADGWLADKDHLSLVAGINVSQMRKLNEAGVQTVQQLATTKRKRIPKLNDDVFRRLKEQAAIQMETRQLQQQAGDAAEEVPPAYRLIDTGGTNAGNGLSQLPPLSPGDVYFDIEGYPLIEGGLEYLWGAVAIERDKPVFHDWWAHNKAQEKWAFEAFIDWVLNRWQHDPAMHIYHYAAYEVSAVRRLMGKHGTREAEVDHLLRHGVFVDLYQIVRKSLLLGASNYSLKTLERLYQEKRLGDVKTAGASMVFYARWTESGESQRWQHSPILKEIRDYNEEDCVSTWQATNWLRGQQISHKIPVCPPKNQNAGDDEAPQLSSGPEAAQRRQRLAEELISQIPQDPADLQKYSEQWQIQQLLAHLLQFHRREEKPVWWAMFDRAAMTETQLIDDLNCLGGLQRTDEPPERIKRSRGYWYTFDPEQDTKISDGQTVYVAHDLSLTLHVQQFDPAGRIQFKVSDSKLAKSKLGEMPDRMSVFPDEHVSPEVLEQAIENLAQGWLKEREIPAALRQFILRNPPVILNAKKGDALVLESEDEVTACVRIVQQMQNSTLCIQGPPGTGKTYTAAQMIASLLRAGKRVGVTSNSHHAILNVLAACAETMQGDLQAMKVGGAEDDPVLRRYPEISYFTNSKDAAFAFSGGLIGGSAWLFSRDDMTGRLDYLFIDEAGQVSIANLAAVSRSANNLVLIGDQMQLSHPTQGSHPDDSGLSVLEYLLHNHAVVPRELGVFLGVTRRMHPGVCEFISSSVYEKRLRAHPSTTERQLVIPRSLQSSPLKSAGIVFVDVPHSGNVQASDEEADVIRELAEQLQKCGYRESGDEKGRPLTINDVLFVAPYNMQVRKLRSQLSAGARVGSVDKFQGQEAPVVIISMCSSANEFGSRGLQFLLNRNRLNVAVSRAKSLAIIVADSRIARTTVASVEEMALVNLFCRLTSHASSTIDLA